MIELLTAAELIQAPTGVDWSSVAEDAGSDDPTQVVEDTNVIQRATWWAGNYCGMPQGLHATEQTEQAITGTSASIGDQVWIDKYAQLNFKTATTPILSVKSSQWTPMGAVLNWQTIDPSTWIVTGPYPQVRHLTNPSQSWTGLRWRPALVSVTYVSGWANALLTADAVAGFGATLSVDTTFGMAAGDSLTIYDAAATETVVIIDVVDGETITVIELRNPHNAGVEISALPPDIKQAAILACVHFVRQRGDVVVGLQGSAGSAPDDSLIEAQNLLMPYRVIV